MTPANADTTSVGSGDMVLHLAMLLALLEVRPGKVCRRDALAGSEGFRKRWDDRSAQIGSLKVGSSGLS